MKKLVVIITFIILALLIIIGLIFYPKYIDNKNKDILYNEISLENYISDLLVNYNKLKENTKEEKILINNLNSDLEKKLENKKDKTKEIKNELDMVINKKDSYYKDNEYIDLYKDLVSNIHINYDNIINDFNNSIDSKMESIKFLNSNKNWKIDNEKIVFIKRNTYNAYSKLNNNTFEYGLIKDTTGPVIMANNITVIKGNKINLNDKIKCQDNIDDIVDCKIEGSYDFNKVGTYSIKISSKDYNGNLTSKTIKLTVKEEKKNQYYIEVIRNQNVVIVYGLDESNNYTKIVKVFLCSVGKENSKTPTGTFKTSDKSSWGWLVGNVYGQYYTRIVGSILFHSVPYYKKDKSTLEWEEYNKLGSAASKGCVRLSVRDVKWIYDNISRGTTVKIYDGNLPKGVSKPSGIKINSDSPNKGWDPTDPDKKNPWR